MSGCATVFNYVPIQLPAFASVHFSDCERANGAAQVQIYYQKILQNGFDVDFAAKYLGDWGIATYTPMGQTLFQINYLGLREEIQVIGRNVEKFDRFSIDSNNFVNFDSYPIGIKPSEIPCLAMGKLPIEWLKRVVKFERSDEAYRVIIRDEGRRTDVLLYKHGDGLDKNWTVNTEWKTYWGLKENSFQLISNKDKTIVLRVKNLENYEIRWQEKDE